MFVEMLADLIEIPRYSVQGWDQPSWFLGQTEGKNCGSYGLGGELRNTIFKTFYNSSMKENADCSVHILALGVLISHRCGPFLIFSYIIFIAN